MKDEHLTLHTMDEQPHKVKVASNGLEAAAAGLKKFSEAMGKVKLSMPNIKTSKNLTDALKQAVESKKADDLMIAQNLGLTAINHNYTPHDKMHHFIAQVNIPKEALTQFSSSDLEYIALSSKQALEYHMQEILKKLAKPKTAVEVAEGQAKEAAKKLGVSFNEMKLGAESAEATVETFNTMKEMFTKALNPVIELCNSPAWQEAMKYVEAKDDCPFNGMSMWDDDELLEYLMQSVEDGDEVPDFVTITKKRLLTVTKMFALQMLDKNLKNVGATGLEPVKWEGDGWPSAHALDNGMYLCWVYSHSECVKDPIVVLMEVFNGEWSSEPMSTDYNLEEELWEMRGYMKLPGWENLVFTGV